MLGEIQDKLDVAKTAAYLLSTARMFLIVPHKKRMRLVVGTY
jgi:hypothetical protein